MTPQQAAREIHETLHRVCRAGYVVSGELCFVVPAQPGVVESVAEVSYGPANLLRVRTQARAPRESPTGDVCFKCGSARMVQAGACKVCLDCGESGGCG